MRIALGIFSHEANTFSPQPTGWDEFRHGQLMRGEEFLQGLAGKATEEAGALGVLRQQPECVVLPLLAARAMSGAPVAGEVFRGLLDELLARLHAVLPVDGVLLVLHGAMMAAAGKDLPAQPDATGEILRAVRAAVGPTVPVVGTLDLHANVTQRMVAEATALVGYHTAPHVDLFEVGARAAQILLATVQGEIRPTMALVRLPLIVPPENARHTSGPLAEVLAPALAAEREGRALYASVFAVQPWMDAEDVGCSMLVVTDNDAAAAQRGAQTLARAFWARRRAFVSELVPPDEALQRALAQDGGLVVLCDSADAPTSGSTGDSTVLLAAALRAEPIEGSVLLNIVDPWAVAQAIAAGVGEMVTLQVGGKLAPAFWEPVPFTGRVRIISEGTFRFKGPGMRGVLYSMGRTVVLVRNGIHLVVMERPVSQWDPELYRSLGLEPADARIAQVKSPAAFRAAYEPLAAGILIIESPGPSSPQLKGLPWQHLHRPIFPLDDDTVWD